MVSERRYYVYIMSSRSRVIYVGVTGYLMARVLRHRAGGGGEFTRKYRVHRLVYFESFQNVENAIARETEIKKWRREKKVELIRRESDLGGFGGGVGGAAEMRVGKQVPHRAFSPIRNDKEFRFGMTRNLDSE